MDAERLIGSLIRGALSGKKKRKRGVIRFLTGGSNSFLSASTLLTAAGVVWGMFESAQSKTTVPRASSTFGGESVSAASGTPAPQPQQPISGSPAARAADIPADLLRLVRLTVSAARADGKLSQEERDQIMDHARQAGVEAVIEEEFHVTRPLSEIVSGVSDPQVKADLYTLAFAIIRADEGVSGAERIYLSQLAHHLGFDSEITAGLEKEAVVRIDQEAAQ